MAIKKIFKEERKIEFSHSKNKKLILVNCLIDADVSLKNKIN